MRHEKLTTSFIAHAERSESLDALSSGRTKLADEEQHNVVLRRDGRDAGRYNHISLPEHGMDFFPFRLALSRGKRKRMLCSIWFTAGMHHFVTECKKNLNNDYAAIG